MNKIKFKVWNKKKKEWVKRPEDFQVGWTFNTDTSEFSVLAYATNDDIEFVPIREGQESGKGVILNKYGALTEIELQNLFKRIKKLEEQLW